MKKCPYCGSELQEGAEFCLYCMRSLNRKADFTPRPKSPKAKNRIIAAVAVLAAIVVGIICFSLRGGDKPSEAVDAHTRQTDESTDSLTSETVAAKETTDTQKEGTSSVPDTTAESRPSVETEVGTVAPTVKIPKGYDDAVWEFIKVDGGIAVTGLASGEGRKFTIPEAIDGKTVVAIEFDGNHDKNSWEGVIELTLPDTVKYIGNYVFQNCELQKIVLPNGLVYIGECAFTGASLTEIIIPDSVTFIDKAAFYSCQDLTFVMLPPSIESIEASTFFMCYKLREIYIPASVTYIDALAFTYCYVLTDVYILGSDVTADIEAFEPDYRETELTIHANEAFIEKHSEYQDDWDAEFVVIS